MLDPCVSAPCDARCCDAAEVPLLEADIERLHAHTGQDPDRFVDATPDRWRVLRGTGLEGCVFRGPVHVGGRTVLGCTVHEARPAACRHYPFVLGQQADGTPATRLDPFCPFAEQFPEQGGTAEALAALERQLEEERRERVV